MSRAASFNFVAVVANLLCWAACSVLGASFTPPTTPATTAVVGGAATTTAATTTTGDQPVRRISRGMRAGTSHQAAAFHITPPVVVDGEVDVFLDLACPDSAAAWATVKQVVWDYGFRTEFVFHILPISQNQAVFDAAKALQVLRMHSADTGERALFIDKMLDHQNLILDEHDDEVARLRFFEEVLVKGAVAQGELTEDQFRWWMKDPQIEKFVRDQLESVASLGVLATPTVLLNGIHMMRLIGDNQLRDFELFVGRGMTPQPLYQHTGGGEISVWALVGDGGGGGGGTGAGEGAAGHDSNAIRSSGLDGRGELPQDDKAIAAVM